MIGSIVGGIISSAVWFLIGFLIRILHEKYKSQKGSRIWGNFIRNKELVIGLTLRKGECVTSTLRTSMEEVKGLTEVIQALKTLKMPYRILSKYTDNDFDQAENILAIGGPRDNKLTRAVLNHYNSIIPVKVDLSKAQFQMGTQNYEPVYENGGEILKKDYALIVLFNEAKLTGFENNRISMVVMGNRGYGTRIGLEVLKSKAWNKRYKQERIRGHSFAVVIKIDFKSNYEYSTSIEQFVTF